MASTPARPRSVGRGRYSLGDLLGRGGASEVYRGRDELLAIDVAVKLFAGDADAAVRERRARETRLLAALNHPGLEAIRDVGEEDDRAYVVLELLTGGSLLERLASGPFRLADVLALGAALADTLTYVHRHGVVHRDIKPSAVLLGAEGRPRLSGFDIALWPDEPDPAPPGMVVGTAAYMSPEQVRHQPLGPASDIYALGLVLLECVTGRLEYSGDPLAAAVARLHRPPDVPPDLPVLLGTLLRGMTLDEPAERPTSEQVGTALRTVARETAREPSPARRPAPGSPQAGSPQAGSPQAGSAEDRTGGPAGSGGPQGDGVFISYRRATSWQLARILYDHLSRAGYDVFMDVAQLDSGNFDRQVLREIENRAHFVVVLQPATRFDGGDDRVDWMRREIAHALVLDRNVVPVMSDGFAFTRDTSLPADIARLSTANGVTIYPDYFDAALDRLQNRFLRRTRGDPGPARTPEPPPAPPIPADRQVSILPGRGAAGVLLGDGPDRVREVLGAAERYEWDRGALWPGRGLELKGVGRSAGTVATITLLKARHGSGVVSHEGRTWEGISVDSTMDDVRKAYGEPGPTTDDRLLSYPARGIEFRFISRRGLMMERIVISRPW